MVGPVVGPVGDPSVVCQSQSCCVRPLRQWIPSRHQWFAGRVRGAMMRWGLVPSPLARAPAFLLQCSGALTVVTGGLLVYILYNLSPPLLAHPSFFSSPHFVSVNVDVRALFFFVCFCVHKCISPGRWSICSRVLESGCQKEWENERIFFLHFFEKMCVSAPVQ